LNKLTNFIELNEAERIWAIGSIHSNLDSFESIKDFIMSEFKQKDKLVFLGNVIGLGNHAKETLTEVNKLRFKIMSKFQIKSDSIVYLRGAQEEMLSKLLQLQTAPNPQEIINWMLEHGVDKTINSYGLQTHELKSISNSGTLNITKWTSNLNKLINSIPGHKEYFLNLKHAAFSSSKKILFVNRGVDISRPLSAQNDCFWWGYQNFSKINQPYNSFVRIVRGYESKHVHDINMSKNNVLCTLFKQPLSNKKIFAGLFRENGEILDIFESN